jgi:hypothetical protein
MGYYYDETPPEEKPPGCLDLLVITRAVFDVLFWPMVVIFGVIIDGALVLYTLSVHPVLALIPVGLTVLAIWLFARWEQRHYRPPDER